MKKNWILSLLALVALVGMQSCEKDMTFGKKGGSVAGTTGVQDVTPPAGCAPAVSYDLLGGQHILVGNLSVLNDETNLYVTYNTTDGWVINEIHLYAGLLAGTPMNKRGNPIPGQFPYKATFANGRTSYTIAIPLSSLPDKCYSIAAHAVVTKDGSSETAWTQDERFANRTGAANWSGFSDYCTQDCTKPVCLMDNSAWGFGTLHTVLSGTTRRCGWFSDYTPGVSQTIDIVDCYLRTVGYATLTDDGNKLTVTYNTGAGVHIQRAYFYVGTLDGLTAIVNDRGFPEPGLFTYKAEIPALTDVYSFEIPLSALQGTAPYTICLNIRQKRSALRIVKGVFFRRRVLLRQRPFFYGKSLRSICRAVLAARSIVYSRSFPNWNIRATI